MYWEKSLLFSGYQEWLTGFFFLKSFLRYLTIPKPGDMVKIAFEYKNPDLQEANRDL